jgi:hypothetical protein
MKFNSTSSTMIGTPPDEQRFRNQCTGIGQTRQASEQTGARRSQRVIDCAPAEQRKFAVGYPTPTPAEYCLAAPGMVPRQTTLRRGG